MKVCPTEKECDVNFRVWLRGRPAQLLAAE